MKNMLFASVALVFLATTPGFASTFDETSTLPNLKSTNVALQLLADKDGGGGSDDGADHDSGDDQGGASNDDNDRDDNDADEDRSDDKRKNNNGGRKPRIPGGSGCDSAQDRAEHPECRAG